MPRQILLHTLLLLSTLANIACAGMIAYFLVEQPRIRTEGWTRIEGAVQLALNDGWPLHVKVVGGPLPISGYVSVLGEIDINSRKPLTVNTTHDLPVYIMNRSIEVSSPIGGLRVRAN